MYTEIRKAKKLMVAQFDNDNHLFFDAMKSIKLQIDQKDSLAYIYIDMMFLSKISSFNSRTNLFHWISSTNLLLSDIAGKWTKNLLLHILYYTNLVGSGTWKLESCKHVQIIASHSFPNSKWKLKY